jgi:hypothetical protein
MRVWSWAEPQGERIRFADIPIATIRTEDWLVDLPSGERWFSPTEKVSTEIMGAARLGDEVWFAWMEGRRVGGEERGARSFPFPNIGMAVVSATSLTLLRQDRLWSERRAYGWPALTADDRDIALICAYGGGDRGAELCLGLLTPPRQLQLVTSGNRRGAGGHYMGVRPAYWSTHHAWSTTGFGAAGFTSNVNPPSPAFNRPRYVLFERT